MKINWIPYTPAKPPESGEYLVVATNKVTGERDWFQSDFVADKYQWKDIEDISLDLVVTHYVKIDLP